MTADPSWVEYEIVLAAHQAALEDHGGAPGVLSQDALKGALIRPQQSHHYSNPQPDIVRLGAIYLHAMCKAHAFNDGNKRTAFYVCRIFLGDNGYTFDPPREEAREFITLVANDRKTGITTEDVDAWVRHHAHPK